MFKELYHYLSNREDVEKIIFCVPHLYFLMGNDLSKNVCDEILSYDSVTFCRRPDEYNVDVTFIADSIGGKVRGCGKVVGVGHGTISKGFYFTDSIWIGRENFVDMLCVPGPYAHTLLSSLLTTSVVPTGMPKLDPAFNKAYDKKSVCEKYGIEVAKKIVLYAPTFNQVLSANGYIGSELFKLIADDREICIKLHGSTPQHFFTLFRKMASQYQGLTVVNDGDITPWLSIADVVISDVSSTMMEAMALNIPVVLFDSPDWGLYHSYNPSEIEYAWREFGYRCTTIDEVKQSVDRALQFPGEKEPLRRVYGAQLMGSTGGSASENVWNECRKLCDIPMANQSPLFSVVIPVKPGEEFFERRIVQLWQQTSMAIELIVVVAEMSPAIESALLCAKNLGFVRSEGVVHATDDSLEAWKVGAKQAKGDYIVYLSPWSMVFRNPFYFAHEIFKQNTSLALLYGCSSEESSARYWQQYGRFDQELENDIEQVAFRLLSKNGLNTSPCSVDVTSDYFILSQEGLTRLQASPNWKDEFGRLNTMVGEGLLTYTTSAELTQSLLSILPKIFQSPELLPEDAVNTVLERLSSDVIKARIGKMLIEKGSIEFGVSLLKDTVKNDYIGDWDSLSTIVSTIKNLGGGPGVWGVLYEAKEEMLKALQRVPQQRDHTSSGENDPVPLTSNKAAQNVLDLLN